MAAPKEKMEKINVRKFLSQWDNDVFQNCAEDLTSDANTLAEKIGMSVENVKELENVCSLDKLQTDQEGCSEFDKYCNLENVPLDSKLMCLSFQKQELERRKKNIHYYAAVIRKMKYKKTDDHLVYNAVNSNNQQKGKTISPENKVVYPDVLMAVHVHRPIKIRQKTTSYEDNARLAAHMSNTWLVLGRQKLTDLRDIIRCVNDLTVPGDMSENPDMECQTYAKDIFKSGFFFIEDTFYNDCREDDARDYSLEIRQWANEPGRKSTAFKTQKMEDTTFLDLTLELGKPYLYMHQGDCEHVLIFSDLRLLTTEDPQDVTLYPFMTRRSSRRRTLCRLCNNNAARWITYNSQFTPENPSFLCDLCFRSLHYDTDNRKIGKFEAYRYFDHHAIA